MSCIYIYSFEGESNIFILGWRNTHRQRTQSTIVNNTAHLFSPFKLFPSRILKGLKNPQATFHLRDIQTRLDAINSYHARRPFNCTDNGDERVSTVQPTLDIINFASPADAEFLKVTARPKSSPVYVIDDSFRKTKNDASRAFRA